MLDQEVSKQTWLTIQHWLLKKKNPSILYLLLNIAHAITLIKFKNFSHTSVRLMVNYMLKWRFEGLGIYPSESQVSTHVKKKKKKK